MSFIKFFNLDVLYFCDNNWLSYGGKLGGKNTVLGTTLPIL